jgi:hypothetical protein
MPSTNFSKQEFLPALSAMTFPPGIKKLAIGYKRENDKWVLAQRIWRSAKGILERKNPTLLEYAITARGRREIVWRRDNGSTPFTCSFHLAANCALCEVYLFGKYPMI